ncbi:ATP-binding protein [Tolypothrix sp. FACHB-123]|uniref:ATP-binding protein n=1 Tax=Tolypothrix sp. FACHB-123 TaxID=2692868 RepID=UPI001687F5C4|nr:ATP-binding protein [Tolypothrix sp. FACHB-123]MBD2358943.1 ATP-binding protein [Tolypothrix sp. FACHB-123]
MMNDVKPSELNQRSYNLPLRLNWAVKLSVAGALVCGIAAHIGDGIAKKDICFYPRRARIHDAPIQAGDGNPNKLLLGKKYCRYEQRSQIPEPYLKANQYRTSNPNYNPWAFLEHDGLYVFRSLSADNPFKIHLGIAAIILGGVGLWATSKAQDYLADIRPHYRATKLFEGVKASYTVRLGEQLLDLSGKELLKYLRGIKIAEARQQFLASITPQQVTALLMAMSADDYYEFGHLLDSGQSFEKFEPQQQPAPQLPHGTPGTVEEQMQQPVIPPDNNTAWVQNLIKQTALIWGNQGGGKSWLARYVAKQKKQAGYRVVVLDPDSNRAEWRGVESYHSWSDIEQQIRDYVEELEARLKTFNNSSLSEEQWRQKLWSEGKALSLICEEATTYGDFIKDEELLSKFGKLALTKSRKQEMPLTVVAHNNTQTCLFGIKGLHNLVSKMLQVECLAEVDPITLQPKSTGKAKVKLDSSNEWILVELPNMTTKISDFNDYSPPTESNPNPPIDQATLERIYELEINLGNKADDTQSESKKLSPMAQKLYEYLTRNERIEADVREFKSNFKVQGERFTVEQIKGWMYEIVSAGLADWIAEGVIKLNQI